MKLITRLSPLAMALALLAAPGASLYAQDAEAEPIEESAIDEGVEDLQMDELSSDDLEPQELGRVEATVDEIDALIALPAGARLREADEDPNNPSDAFEERGVENLLGTSPRVVYVPQGISPMIIPWVREQVVLEELQEEVNRLRSSGTPENLQKALEISRRAIEQYGGNPNAQWARQAEASLLVALRSPDEQQDETPVEIVQGPSTEDVVLPAWIRDNTMGIMFDRSNPANSLVVVGRELLNPGQRVPRYSQVVVKEVGQSTVGDKVEDGYVVYEFRNREFLVPVRETR